MHSSAGPVLCLSAYCTRDIVIAISEKKWAAELSLKGHKASVGQQGVPLTDTKLRNYTIKAAWSTLIKFFLICISMCIWRSTPRLCYFFSSPIPSPCSQLISNCWVLLFPLSPHSSLCPASHWAMVGICSTCIYTGSIIFWQFSGFPACCCRWHRGGIGAC